MAHYSNFTGLPVNARLTLQCTGGIYVTSSFHWPSARWVRHRRSGLEATQGAPKLSRRIHADLWQVEGHSGGLKTLLTDLIIVNTCPICPLGLLCHPTCARLCTGVLQVGMHCGPNCSEVPNQACLLIALPLVGLTRCHTKHRCLKYISRPRFWLGVGW